jgi:hypothetical protein
MARLKRRFPGNWAAVSVLLSAISPAVACVPVDPDRSQAKHLAIANSDFTVLDPRLELGYAPRPGFTRLFRAEEQERLAQRYGVEKSHKFIDICFANAMAPLLSAGLSPRDVERGERVSVEVSAGNARLTFEAEAASAGRAGDSVLVKNPENGRLFQAKVQGKGKVAVQK